jgi:ABC-2 type transport system ATP-binding protein
MSNPPADPIIELTQLGRHFGVNRVLRDVNVHIPAGRIGLLGPNGAGKSTLLKILTGLLSPSEGSGRVLDVAIVPGDGEGDFELRRRIGFMPEADALVPGLRGVDYVTLAGELYGLPRKQAVRRAHEVLTYMQLEDARYRRLEEYSTGMKQRLKLAQAIVHDPPLLLLDEPTSGLDPASRDAMLKLLVELGRDFGKSIILSTHLLADVETACERVVLLFGGRITGMGTVAELLNHRRDRFVIRVQGDLSRYRQVTEARGVTIVGQSTKGEFHVSVPTGWTPRDAFVIASESACQVRAVLPDDESLEEMFLRNAAGNG